VGLPDLVAMIVFLGVVLYAVFGGADFGSGFWDLTAGDARRGGAVRRLVDHSIGPVWEANHVWLIFVLVYLWTGFPRAFVQIVSALYVPLSLAALGIVLRGSGFAFRKFATTVRQARVYGAAFALSSVVTPFFFGTAVGAIASGRVPAEGGVSRGTVWLSPTSLLGGVLAVLTCAFLAAVFLARDAQRLGQDDLTHWFRRRGLALGIVTGGVALAGVAVLAVDAPTLFRGLTGWALPIVGGSGVGGLATMWLLRAERYGLARWFAVASVALVVIGWGVGQYPWMLVDELTITDAAGARTTLWALVVAFLAAAVLVIPPLGYLLWLTDQGMLGSEAPRSAEDAAS
jgi:cytochrome d ubiquinol oxidase subunit II